MTQNIKDIFNERTEIPLFYIESGSRLWGIDSPDSDYDVRGFHLVSKQQYYDFRKPPEVIEIMQGDFDFVSYDIDKMFGLLAKGNPTVLEWIRSHIIYYNILPDWEQFRNEILCNIDFKGMFHHYISIAKGNIHRMETESKFTYKVLFYCIRGLLSADLCVQNIMPDLLIDNLFKQFNRETELISLAKECLIKKKSLTEDQEVDPLEKEVILRAVKQYMDEIELKEPKVRSDKRMLESILKDYCVSIKNIYYS